MPIYRHNGARYNINNDEVEDFLKDMPGAELEEVPYYLENPRNNEAMLEQEPVQEPLQQPDDLIDRATGAQAGMMAGGLDYVAPQQEPAPQRAPLDTIQQRPLVQDSGADVLGQDTSSIDIEEKRRQAFEGPIMTIKDKEKMEREHEMFVEGLEGDVDDLIAKVNEGIRTNRDESMIPGTAGRSQYAPVGAIGGSGVFRSAEAGREERAYRTAQRYLKESEQLFDLIKKTENASAPNLKAAGVAAGQTLTDIKTWDMGVTEMVDTVTLNDAIKKIDNGEPLTKAQEAMMDALALNLAVTANYSEDVPRGATWGEVGAQSVPFMLEFILNPASGIGKGITKSVAKYGLRRFGQTSGGRIGSRIVGQLAGDATSAMGMVTTTGALRTAGDVMGRMQGEATYEVDDDLNPVYAGQVGQENLGEALYKGVASNWIEYYSEMTGQSFGHVGKMIGRSTPGKAIRNSFDATGFGKAMSRMADSKDWRAFKALEQSAQWSGTVGEYFEEVIGTVLNATFVGDSKFSDLADVDQQVDTFMGLALTGGAMSTFGTATYARDLASAPLKVADRYKRGQEQFENWGDLAERINSMDVAQRTEAVKALNRRPDIPQEAKKAYADYAGMKTYAETLSGAKRGRLEASGENGQAVGQELYGDVQDKRSARLESSYQEMQAKRAELGDIADYTAEQVADMSDAGEITGEQVIAWEAYNHLLGEYTGAMEMVQRDVEEAIGKEMEAIAPTTKDGSITEINIGTNESPDIVYLKDGDVTLTEEGEIDPDNTSEILTVHKDGRTMLIPRKRIHSAKINTQQEIEHGIREGVYEQYVYPLADRLEGKFTFKEGEAVEYTNEKGEATAGTIVATQGETVTVLSNDGKKTETLEARKLGHSLVGTVTPSGYRVRDVVQVNVEGEQMEARVTGIRDGKITLHIPGHPVMSQKWQDVTDAQLSAMVVLPQSAEIGATDVKSEGSSAGEDQQVSPKAGNEEQIVNEEPKVEYPRTKDGDIDYDQITDDASFVGALQEEYAETPEEVPAILQEYKAQAEEEVVKAESVKDPIKRRREVAKAKAKTVRFSGMLDALNQATKEAEQPVEVPQNEQQPAVNEDESVPVQPTLEVVPEVEVVKNEAKEQQFTILQSTNPMTDDVHTGVRSVGDILTAEEAFSESINNNEDATPDFTVSDMKQAVETGSVQVYSSTPIQNGVFVTPSKMEAQNFAGEGQVYTATVPVGNVAWIDQTQGQYAEVEQAPAEQVEQNEQQATEQAEQKSQPPSVGRRKLGNIMFINKLSRAYNTPVKIHYDKSTVENGNVLAEIEKNEGLRANGEQSERIPGWYDKNTGEVNFYLPDMVSNSDAGLTFVHEVIAHKGVKGLLGAKHQEVLERIFDALPQEIQDDYAERYATEDGFDKYTAADEWLAEFAEGFDFENNDDRNFFQQIVDLILDALGLSRPTAEEIARELLLDSESRLRGREITPSDRLRIQGIKYTKESKDQESDGVNFRKVGNEELYSQAEKAQKVLDSYTPGVKITIHPTTEAFMAGAKGYRNIRPTDRGATLYDANGNATEILINAERANERTIAHETAHPILSKALREDPTLAQKVRDDVMKALSESTNKELKRFAYAYNPSARADEFLAELTGLMASQRVDKSTLQKIKEIINKIVKKLTGHVVFADADRAKDVYNLFDDMARSIRLGEELSLSEEMLRGDEVGPATNRPFVLNVDAFLKAYSQADVVKKPDNPEYKDVPQVDVAQVLVDFKEKNGRDPKVYVWMGDQMKRGEYNNEESGVKVFLEGGLMFAFDPAHREHNVVWATSSGGKVKNNIKESDFIIVFAGAPGSAHQQARNTGEVYLAEIDSAISKLIGGKKRKTIEVKGKKYTLSGSGFPTFKGIIMQLLKDVEKPSKEDKYLMGYLSNANSYEELLDGPGGKAVNPRWGSKRKAFLDALIMKEPVNAQKGLPQFIHNILGIPYLDQMSERLRDDLLSENDFIQGEVMLLLKPSGELAEGGQDAYGGAYHSTYTHLVLGEAIGIPNRKLDLYHEIPKISYANDGKFIKDRPMRMVKINHGLLLEGEDFNFYRDAVKDKDLGFSKSQISGEIGMNNDAYPNMTEDGEGNFVFFHRSHKRLDEINPGRIGSNPSNITSRNEQMGLQGTSLSMYYTVPYAAESGTGNEVHVVKVPKEKVYDLHADKDGLKEEAKRRFHQYHADRGIPNFAWSGNAMVGWTTQVAVENGYDMTIIRWDPQAGHPMYLRAQTALPMVPEKGVDHSKFESNYQKGYRANIPPSRDKLLMRFYDKVQSIRYDEGRYDDIYNLRVDANPTKGFTPERTFKNPYNSQEEVTAIIQESDLAQELKDEYMEIAYGNLGEVTVEKTDIIGETRPKYVDPRDILYKRNVESMVRALPKVGMDRPGLEAIVKGDKPFATLTAENPGNVATTEEHNARLTALADKWLKEKGYDTHRIVGKYDGLENSYLIPEMSLADTYEFGLVFGQESVAHREGLLYTTGEHENMFQPRTYGEERFDVDYLNPKENYFSVINVGKPLGFSMEYAWEFNPLEELIPEKDLLKAKENAKKWEDAILDADHSPLYRKASEETTEFLQSENPYEYTELAEEDIPQNTQVAYKLMRYMPSKPGMLFPLFAKDGSTSKGFKKGKWYGAEAQTVKGLAYRPGIHAVSLPLFLQGKVQVKGETRVWARVEMPEMSPETQAENDATPMTGSQREGIRSRVIGPKEAYNFKTNNNAYGADAWPIAGSMRIMEVLSDAQVEEVLAQAGRSQYVDRSMTGNPSIIFRKVDEAGFYSTIEDALLHIPQKKGSPEQMKAMLLKNGAKKAELDWIGYDEAFTGKSVTEADILDLLEDNRIEIAEVHRHGPYDIDVDAFLEDEAGEGMTWDEAYEYLNDGDTATRYQNGAINGIETELPGGKNYREYLLTMPAKEAPKTYSVIFENGLYKVKDDITGKLIPGATSYTKEGAQNLADFGSEIRENKKNKTFQSVHWDEPNIVAHVRVNDREWSTDNKGYTDLSKLELDFDEGFDLTDNGSSYKVVRKTDGKEYANSYPKDLLERMGMDGQGLKTYLMGTALREEHPTYQAAKSVPSTIKEKVLFLEEVQSDWAQEGRKKGFVKNRQEYEALRAEIKRAREERDSYRLEVDPLMQRSNEELISEYPKLGELDNRYNSLVEQYDRMDIKPGAPVDMPFKNTDQWLNLAIRRMMMHASENGYDRIAWTTGQQQADRYDLSQQVDKISYAKNNNDTYYLLVQNGDSNIIEREEINPYGIEETLGKEIATKIANNEGANVPNRFEPNLMVLSGLDLKVGGEGMIGFYDNMVPKAMNKLGKPFGSKVEVINMWDVGEVMSLPVTDAMRESARGGFPLFRKTPALSAMDQALDNAKSEKERHGILKEMLGEIESSHQSTIESEVVRNRRGLFKRLRELGGDKDDIKQLAKDSDILQAVFFDGTVLFDGEYIASSDDLLSTWSHENFHGWARSNQDLIASTTGKFSEELINGSLGKGYHRKDEVAKMEEILAYAVESIYVGGPITKRKEIRSVLDPVVKKYLDYATNGQFSKDYPDFGADESALRNIPTGGEVRTAENATGATATKRGEKGGDIQESDATVSGEVRFRKINVDGVDRSVENSEGDPIAQTEEGVRNFWEWFGDSKVVDAQGRPLVVYHGTPATDINSFKRVPGSEFGFHFSPSRDVAKGMSIRYDDVTGEKKTGDVMPVYLNIQSMAEVPDLRTWTSKGLREISERLEIPYNKGIDLKEGLDNISNFENPDPLANIDGYKYYNEYEKPGKPLTKENRWLYDSYIVLNPNQIKSATGNVGTFDPNNEDIRFRKVGDAGFYSPTEEALGLIKQEKGTPEQFKAMLLKNGAKQAELDWMGWDERFPDGGQTISKSDIQDWIDQDRIEVEEVEKGNPKIKWEEKDGIYTLGNYVVEKNIHGDWAVTEKGEGWHGNYSTLDGAKNFAESNAKGYTNTKFSAYTLPGGKNYRELLLTMPKDKGLLWKQNKAGLWAYFVGDKQVSDGVPSDEYKEIARNTINSRDVRELQNADFKSAHFNEPNILAHVRFNERTVNGERVLFLEEIQSDWAQKGKKEGFKSDSNEYNSVFAELVRIRDEKEAYRKEIDPYKEYSIPSLKAEYPRMKELDEKENQLIDREYELRRKKNGVPDMPFKKTDQWVNLALRRMMMYAAENGYDRIAWTTGQQQADRYDLSKQINTIYYSKNSTPGEATYDLDVLSNRGTYTMFNDLNESALEDHIGKELAKKVVSDESGSGKIDGLNLKIGGSGMIAFYDQIVPKAAKKLGKPFGAEVETIQMHLNNVEVNPDSLPREVRELRHYYFNGAIEIDELSSEFDRLGYEYSLGEDGEIENVYKKGGDSYSFQSIPVTDALREMAPGGMPLFRKVSESQARNEHLSEMVDNYPKALVDVFTGAPAEVQETIIGRGLPNAVRSIEDYMESVEGEELNRIGKVLGLDLPENVLSYSIWRGLHPDDGSVRWKAENAVKANDANRNILFRKAKEPSESDVEEYNRRIARRGRKKGVNFMYGLEEGYLDSMASLRILQDAITGGNPINEGANAYMVWTTLSSKNRAHSMRFMADYIQPMSKAVSSIFGNDMEAADNYLIAKHGLERNVYMAHREADKYAEREKAKRMNEYKNSLKFRSDYRSLSLADIETLMEDHSIHLDKVMNGFSEEEVSEWTAIQMRAVEKQIEELGLNPQEGAPLKGAVTKEANKMRLGLRNQRLNQNLKNDYSGLTGLAEELGDDRPFTEVAQEIVALVEAENDVNDLWEKINAATKFVLQRQYEAGMMTTEVYNDVSTMFQYYTPLRGFSETISTDLWEYLEMKPISSVGGMKRAKGRNSKPDSPLATIMGMADSGLANANKNELKQRLYRLIETNKTNVASIEDVWMVHDGKNWVESYPDITADMSEADFQEALNDFHERMAELESEGMARKGHNKLDAGVRVLAHQAPEHIVNVWVDGEKKVIYINGNPRAAQAINGLTSDLSPLADSGVARASRHIRGNMSAFFTSRNPAFMVTNLMRDVQFAIVSSAVKEGAAYSTVLAGNIMTVPKTIALNAWNVDNKKSGEFQQYWDEFLMNGGETGFTNQNTIDQYKREMKSELSRLNGDRDFTKVFRLIAEQIENGNRFVEDISRFATYVTSRQMGRSVDRSVMDAKEITINFNRKGSGTHGSWLFKEMYLFMNPTFQGLRMMGLLAKNHTGNFLAMMASSLGGGFVVPMINELLLSAVGDDDDKEKYWNISPWIRRNNVVMYAPWTEDKFITLMLPHEIRGMYGVGEIAYSAVTGRLRTEDPLFEAAKQLTAMLPVDPMGSSDWWMPDVVKPPLQAYITNKNFMGSPIYRDTPWNKLDPEWTKAYKRTPKGLVDFTKWLNEFSGGDDVVGGRFDLNPARIDHLIDGYFGGFVTTYTGGINVLHKLIVGEGVTANDIPIANKVVRTSDEGTEMTRVRNEYFFYLDWMDDFKHRESGYKKLMKEDEEYRRKYKQLMDGFEARVYKLASNEKKKIDKVRKHDPEKADEMMKDFNNIMREQEYRFNLEW